MKSGGSHVANVYAATVAAATGAWLAAATVLGPSHRPLPQVLFLAGLVLAVPWWAHRRRRAKVRVERKLEAWPEIAQTIGLAGSRVMSAVVDLWGWRARFALARGQTIEDVIAKLPAIESALGTYRGAARVYPTDDDLANRFELRILDKDPHAGAIAWPGPSVASITEPIDLGPFEDAAPARVLFLRRHGLFGGVSGSGKSGGLNVLMANLSACMDVVIWAIDLKKGMELSPWAACIDRLATTPAEARALLHDAVDVLEARAAMLAASGQRVWEPSPELPALVIIIDEYAELADDAPDATTQADSIARRGRAVAVTLIAATQRPTQKGTGSSTPGRVRRIFAEFLAGYGIYAIAERLTADGIPCPSAHDPDRNRHRCGIAWNKYAVRAILMNPRYTGRQVWNRQRKDEVLIDVHDVALGHMTKMRWNDEEKWIFSEKIVHPPVIDDGTFRRAQDLLTARRGVRGPHKPHKSRHDYVLRGLLFCGICERRMQGHWANAAPYYRCRFPSEYALANRVPHPLNVTLRQDAILEPLDAWLTRKFAPRHLPATIEELAASSPVSSSSRAGHERGGGPLDQVDNYRMRCPARAHSGNGLLPAHAYPRGAPRAARLGCGAHAFVSRRNDRRGINNVAGRLAVRRSGWRLAVGAARCRQRGEPGRQRRGG